MGRVFGILYRTAAPQPAGGSRRSRNKGECDWASVCARWRSSRRRPGASAATGLVRAAARRHRDSLAPFRNGRAAASH
jgi:hypothetical protein